MIDKEIDRKYPFVSNQFEEIDQAQYDAISSMLKKGYDTWYVTHTCADYARDVYYKATGVYLDVDDYMGIETPRELAKSIGN
ncbi:hypothetical protein [Hydrogenimonas sp.]